MISDFLSLDTLRIVEPLSYEQNKKLLLDLFAAISPDTVLYESSDEMVLLEAVAYAMTYKDEMLNARMRAILPTLAEGQNLDDSAKNFYGSTRLEGESDDAFLQRSFALLQQSVTTGSDESYIGHTKSVDVRIGDVFPYRSGPGEVTVVWHSYSETDVAELDTIQSNIEAVLFDTKRRPLCATSQRVVRATVVPFDVQVKLSIYSALQRESLVAKAESAIRAFYKQHPISREVNLSKITALAHLEGVDKVTVLNPSANVVIGKEEVAVLGTVTIETEEVQDV